MRDEPFFNTHVALAVEPVGLPQLLPSRLAVQLRVHVGDRALLVALDHSLGEDVHVAVLDVGDLAVGIAAVVQRRRDWENTGGFKRGKHGCVKLERLFTLGTPRERVPLVPGSFPRVVVVGVGVQVDVVDVHRAGENRVLVRGLFSHSLRFFIDEPSDVVRQRALRGDRGHDVLHERVWHLDAERVHLYRAAHRRVPVQRAHANGG